MGVDFVQAHVANVGGGTDTPSLTLAGQIVTAGNLLEVTATYDLGLTCNSVTDQNGNLYAKAVERTHTGGAFPIVLAKWYSTNVSVAVTNTPTLTLHLSGITTLCFMGICEYTGQIQTSNVAVLGHVGTGNCDTGCGPSPINMSTESILASAGSAVCIAGQVDHGTISPNSPWNDRGTDTFIGLSLADRTNALAGSYSGRMTDSGLDNDNWVMLIVEYKALGGFGPSNDISVLRGTHRVSRMTPPYNP